MTPQQLWLDFLRFLLRHDFWVRLGVTAVLALAAVFGTRLYRKLIGAVLGRLRKHMPAWLGIVLNGFSEPMVLMLRCGLLYLAVVACPLPLTTAEVLRLVQPFFGAALLLLLAWGFWRSEALCGLLLGSAQSKLDHEDDKTIVRFFEKIYRAVILGVAALAVLENFGIPVAGLLAGAGVAGLAVSLAAQSTLSSLIAGITLVIERPFRIGDYVTLGTLEGTVQQISLRSTQLRTPDNCLITVENSKVCAEYIQNATERDSRLWNFVIGVTYDTTRAQLEALCAGLAELCRADPAVRPETVHVAVAAFNASSIDIDVRLYCTALGLAEFREMKTRLNLQIMGLMEREGCGFAPRPASTSKKPRRRQAMPNILLVEDDDALSEGIALALRAQGTVRRCPTLAEAREALGRAGFDLMILDINLPDGSGLALLRERPAGDRTPVLVLTANDLEIDIVNGLEAGADDYVTKPFSLAVLRARVTALLRRCEGKPAGEIYETGGLRLDFTAGRFEKNGTPIELSRREQALLRLLVANAGNTLPRALLLDRVWGDDFVEENALSVAVKRLRDKLEDDPARPVRLRTVYGIGYRWEAAP